MKLLHCLPINYFYSVKDHVSVALTCFKKSGHALLPVRYQAITKSHIIYTVIDFATGNKETTDVKQSQKVIQILVKCHFGNA